MVIRIKEYEIKIDFWVYLNILVDHVFNLYKNIRIKTIPDLKIEIPLKLHLTSLKKYENIYNNNLLYYITYNGFVPLNQVLVHDIILTDDPLLTKNLKKISFTGIYSQTINRSTPRTKQCTIIGTGQDEEVTINDFLKGIFSLKRQLQYQLVENIFIKNIEYELNKLHVNVIYGISYSNHSRLPLLYINSI